MVAVYWMGDFFIGTDKKVPFCIHYKNFNRKEECSGNGIEKACIGKDIIGCQILRNILEFQ